MSNYQIFSDGACDMPHALAAQHQIKLIPFYVSLDNMQYQKEIEELSLASFYDFIIKENGFPKTSLPSVQDYIDAFTLELEAGRDILCLTMTESLTASHQSACTAKLMLEETYPNAKIVVANTFAATGTQTLVLLEAARMQADGYDMEEVAAYVEKSRQDSRIHFMIGTLRYLEKGGRIGKIAALSGSILNIKPLIVFRQGEIHIGGAVRSRKKGLAKLAEITAKYFAETGHNPQDYLCMLGATNLFEELKSFAAVLQEMIPQITFLEPFQIGATIASHTGPDTIGLCFAKKYTAYMTP